MAAIEIMPVKLGHAKIRGEKNEADLQTVTQGITDVIKTYLDGTADTHDGYHVRVKVTKQGI